MILDVDGGNTRLKWCLRTTEGVADRGAGELGVLLDTLSRSEASVDLIRVASVATDHYKSHLSSALEAATGIKPAFALSQQQWGDLTSAYASPAQMGVDRWLAMVAGWERGRRGFAVVDAGSALTIDFVGDEGGHLGGYILPGWRMLLESLSRGTAKVRPAALSAGWFSLPGVDTSTCVNYGAAWLWESWVARLNADCVKLALNTCFLTGGDAERVKAAGLDAVVWPDMVLDGLGLLPDDAFVSLSNR